MPLLLLVLPIVSTLAGGMLAIRMRRHVSFLIALGAGLLLGAALLDLLPEAISLGRQAGMSFLTVLALTLLALLLFQGFETALDWFGRRLADRDAGRRTVRRTGASLLIFHSFRDGMAIGAAFAASHPAGYAVALGIAAHDLGDGMNTVLLTTDGKPATRVDYGFLLADAIAPFLGGVLTIWWVLSQVNSVLLLVAAAGFFLQMAIAGFLPELRKPESRRSLLILALLAGAAFIYLANLLIARGR